MTLALKFLTEKGTGGYSGFDWPMPKGAKPGAWVSVKGKLEPCHNGVHAATPDQAMKWLNDRALLIELGGKVIDNGDKLVARKGRLVRELEWNPRLYACDVAEHVLPIFEKAYPDDTRPRTAIEVSRRYANGEATEQERAAAGAAAGAAAWAAAWDAAWAAARAAERNWQAELLLTHFGLTRGDFE